MRSGGGLLDLKLADAIASAAAHRLFPLVELDDLLQVAVG